MAFAIEHAPTPSAAVVRATPARAGTSGPLRLGVTQRNARASDRRDPLAVSLATCVANRRRLARAITLKFSKGAYVVTGRAEWVAADKLTASLIAEWNRNHEDEQIDEDASLKEEDLDRCHKLAWMNIRDDILVPFLNGELSLKKMQGQIEMLWGGDWDELLDEDDLMPYKREAEKAAKSVATLLDDDAELSELQGPVKRLANLLNSGRANLRLDAHKMNIKIKQRHDPHLVYVDSDEEDYRMTPHSKQILADREKFFMYSPGGSSVASSSMGGLFLPIGSATPESRSMMEIDDDY